MAYQVGSTEVISNTRVLKNVTIDSGVPITLPSYVVKTTFTSSGTFTKNANDLYYLVEVWGAGGSGGKNTSIFGAGRGGGGGGYNKLFIAAADIPGPVSVTVGAGGQQTPTPGPPYIGGAYNAGTPGGASYFGNYLRVSGGFGGWVNFGGLGGPGFDSKPPTLPGNSTNVIADSQFLQGGYTGYSAYYGGGGGGDTLYNNPTGDVYPAYKRAGYSVYGGGGGGVINPTAMLPTIPANDPGPLAIGGGSVFGGAGGNAAGGNGSDRGGGGAAMGPTQNPANQGKGGRGEVVVYAWRK